MCIYLLKEKGIYTTPYSFLREKEVGQVPFLGSLQKKGAAYYGIFGWCLLVKSLDNPVLDPFVVSATDPVDEDIQSIKPQKNG